MTVPARHGASVAIDPKEKGGSWKVLAVLGAVAFFGSLGATLAVEKWLFGDTWLSPRGQAVPELRIRLLERAAGRNPGHSDAWFSLGRACGENGRTVEAAAAYDKSAAIHPGCADHWGQLGIQYMKAGQPAKALAAFDRAIALDPQRETAHLYRALALLHVLDDLTGPNRGWSRAGILNAAAPLAGNGLGEEAAERLSSPNIEFLQSGGNQE